MTYFAKALFIVALCLTLPAELSAEAPTLEELQQQLDNTASDDEKLGILCDMTDVAPFQDKAKYAQKAVEMALHTGDYDCGLDMLRTLANSHPTKTQLLEKDLSLLLKFPKSIDRDETECFMRILLNYSRATTMKETDEDVYIQNLVHSFHDKSVTDIYDRIVTLHDLCIHIANVSNGHLLSNYLDQLEKEIESLRPEAYFLRNTFYVQASLAYNTDDIARDRALKYDKKLLDIINSLEHGEMGRPHPYRNYDPSRYVIYSRMLRNYEAMTTEEVDDIYQRAMDLVARNPTAAKTNDDSLRPQIFLAAKHGDTATLLSLLKKGIDLPYNETIRLSLLKLMTQAAQAEGDDEALKEASIEYSKALESKLYARDHENWRELQIVYDINKIKEEYSQKEMDMRTEMLLFSGIATLVLISLLILVLILWHRSRRAAKNAIKANAELKVECDALKSASAEIAKARDHAKMADRVKDAFIRNMSEEVKLPLNAILEYTHLIVDCSDAVNRPYLKQYADMMVRNAKTLSTLIDDVLSLAMIDNNSIDTRVSRESVYRLCNTALKSVQALVHSGVELKIADDRPDIMLSTDPNRFLQILWQLLSNAAKFTKAGVITIDYHIDRATDHAIISVTDTGTGINPKNAERIFERFVRLDPTVPGAGIGLPLARSLANVLGGTLHLDTTYAGGARFVLTLPLD